MKFNLKDFIQLDTDGLLAVNGGSPCAASPSGSPSSGGDPGSGGSGGGGGSSGGNSGGSGGDSSGGNGSSSNSTSGNSGYRVTENKDGTITVHQPDGHSYTYSKNNKKQTTSGSGSRGGYCSGASDGTTRTKNPYYQDDDGGDDKGGTNKPGSRPDDAVPDASGGCGKISTPSNPPVPEIPVVEEPEEPPLEELPGYLVCSNPNDYHCDIIAWNHAVDAGLDPRGQGGTDWDANNKTVDQIYNEHFVGKDVDFDGNQAGKMGYILYDWEGDGEYDHIEFGSISDDGLSYSYYSNSGFDGTDENGNPQENYYTRYFSNDSNAHADNNGNGIVRFIPLN